MVNGLDYKDVNFLYLKKIIKRLNKENDMNVFCYVNCSTYPVHISKQKFKDYMDLLLINPIQHKINCLQCYSSKRVLVEHKETCLKINGKQTVKLRSGSIKFKNHFEQLAVPFKFYADFESNLEKIHSNERGNDTSYIKKIKIIFYVVLFIKLYVLMIILVNQLLFT